LSVAVVLAMQLTEMVVTVVPPHSILYLQLVAAAVEEAASIFLGLMVVVAAAEIQTVQVERGQSDKTAARQPALFSVAVEAAEWPQSADRRPTQMVATGGQVSQTQ
jgi:hypothetical protein